MRATPIRFGDSFIHGPFNPEDLGSLGTAPKVGSTIFLFFLSVDRSEAGRSMNDMDESEPKSC